MYNASIATFEPLSLSTGSGTNICSFATADYPNQGVINSSDNCYYVFNNTVHTGFTEGALCQINLSSGNLIVYCNYSKGYYNGLAYNRKNNKLYCRVYLPSSLIYIGEITFTAATTFKIITLAYPFHRFRGDNTPVDEHTGTIYYTTGDDTSTFYIEKYIPDSQRSTIIATITETRDLLGLTFNRNDNMLYAIRKHALQGNSYSYSFIRIDPNSGITSAVSSLSVNIRGDYFSACIDPCSNTYMFSTPAANNYLSDSSLIYQIDMTTLTMQCITTFGIFQGLSVSY